MDEAPQKPATRFGWRHAAAIGLAIGFAHPVARAVAAGLEPSLGYPLAFVASLFAAAAVGGLVGLAGMLIPAPAEAPRKRA